MDVFHQQASQPIERVFMGIEEEGWTRETPYTEEFRREKYRRLREEGWTIIT